MPNFVAKNAYKNVLGDIPEATITLTVEYNKDTAKYIITDVAIKEL